jgi:hypothetical protein
LIEIGLADDDGARGLEPLDREAGLGSRVSEGGAGGGGRQAGDVDVVFDGERDAEQRLARRTGGVELRRQRERVRLGA